VSNAQQLRMFQTPWNVWPLKALQSFEISLTLHLHTNGRGVLSDTTSSAAEQRESRISQQILRFARMFQSVQRSLQRPIERETNCCPQFFMNERK
jgi:hypothetical protein